MIRYRNAQTLERLSVNDAANVVRQGKQNKSRESNVLQSKSASESGK